MTSILTKFPLCSVCHKQHVKRLDAIICSECRKDAYFSEPPPRAAHKSTHPLCGMCHTIHIREDLGHLYCYECRKQIVRNLKKTEWLARTCKACAKIIMRKPGQICSRCNRGVEKPFFLYDPSIDIMK